MNFITWKPMIDIGFWTRLAKKKIEEYKLDDSPKSLEAKFRLSNQPMKISMISIDSYSFGDTLEGDRSGPVEYKISGAFKNFNTVEDFSKVDLDKEEELLMDAEWEKIKKFSVGEELNFITEIKLFIFGDFKKHTFSFYFLSPAIPVEDYKVLKTSPACNYYEGEQKENFITKINSFIHSFCVKEKKPLPQISILKNLEASSIKEYSTNPDGDYMFVVVDSSNFENHTGYHTSTVLSMFSFLREEGIVSSERLLKVKVLFMKEYLIYGLEKNYPFKHSEIVELDLSSIKRAGNERKISPERKLVELDLKSFMDPLLITEQAVDLNIKLMKWRLLPSLDLDKIKEKKCLLFGAGTLGCQLARNLIGWGIKNITFIDYSTVSPSNPVRQSLYEYEDTLNGGKPKALTAAEKLIKIYPKINAKGIHMSIPMPGHYVTKKEHIEETFKNLDELEKLVEEHDVLFLLLDSREARWLPTVLANKYDKACITVGLGFDSFVIVRHGVSPSVFNAEKHKERICCYFCNDIITPQNTMKDRTLDQQCTVTRPGLSFLASAYASELYVSLIHHPLEHHAPANEDQNKLESTDLGKLPHHIRGNMSDFETNLFYGHAFDKCVACSDYILKEYTNNRDDFMLRVLNDPSFIHEVVELKEEIENFDKMGYNIIEILDDEMGEFSEVSEVPTNTEINK